MNDLPLVEIFSSIQGEGPWVGVRQIFIRLFGCDVFCAYCDTPHETAPAHCVVTGIAGGTSRVPNPVPLEEALAILQRYTGDYPGLHHSASITGGEPLLHAETLRKWLPEIRTILPVYLETAGLHVEELRSVIGMTDFVSMDIKLPSVTGLSPQWDRHRAFLEVARSAETYVKIVVGAATPLAEIRAAASVVADCGGDVPLVIQPVTGSTGRPGVSPEALLRFQEAASSRVADVRVIPQVHRFLDVL